MLRFALSADGVVTPDIRRKLPGRGVWTQLERRGGAARGGQRRVRARLPHEGGCAAAASPRQVDALLEQDALQLLSMVNKAGLVVAGAFKVEAAIANGRSSRR